MVTLKFQTVMTSQYKLSAMALLSPAFTSSYHSISQNSFYFLSLLDFYSSASFLLYFTYFFYSMSSQEDAKPRPDSPTLGDVPATTQTDSPTLGTEPQSEVTIRDPREQQQSGESSKSKSSKLKSRKPTPRPLSIIPEKDPHYNYSNPSKNEKKAYSPTEKKKPGK